MSELPREKGANVLNGEHAQVAIPGATQTVSVADGATEALVLTDSCAWLTLDITGSVRLRRVGDAGPGFPLRDGGVYAFGLPQDGTGLELLNSSGAAATVEIMEGGA